jgi:hypothetical protein
MREPVRVLDPQASAEARFLRYRMRVVLDWPASPLKSATLEAINQEARSLHVLQSAVQITTDQE